MSMEIAGATISAASTMAVAGMQQMTEAGKAVGGAISSSVANIGNMIATIVETSNPPPATEAESIDQARK